MSYTGLNFGAGIWRFIFMAYFLFHTNLFNFIGAVICGLLGIANMWVAFNHLETNLIQNNKGLKNEYHKSS